MNNRQLARAVTTNWISFAVNALISFFLAPFVVKHLGSVYYGIWAVTLQFTGYLYLLDFGVRESVIRYTARFMARGRHRMLTDTLSAAIVVYAPIILLTLALTGLCVWGIPRWLDIDAQYANAARWAVLFVGLTIAQTFFFNVFAGVLMGLHRNDLTNLIGIAVTLARTAVIVWLLKAGYGLPALAGAQFGAALTMGVITAFVAWRMLRARGMPRLVRLLPRRRLAALSRRVFGFGFFVLVNNVAQKVISASDAIVVAAFLPLTAVTHYTIGGTLIEPLRGLLASTGNAFSPMASHLHTLRDWGELRRTFLSGAKLAVVVALPFAVGFSILGHDFIGLWMGAEFAGPAAPVLAVLAINQLLSAPHHVMTSMLYGMSRHHTIAWLRIGEAAVNVGLSVLLIKRMGIVGVALGTLVSHSVVATVILPIIVCRAIGLSFGAYLLQTFGRTLVAAVPMGIAAWFVARHAPETMLGFLSIAAALGALYVATAYFVALGDSERARIRGFLLRRRAAA